MAVKKEKASVRTFSKAQLMTSKRYRDKTDLVDALLIDGKTYTMDEVDEIIENFLKGKVN